MKDARIILGAADGKPVYQLGAMSNRHGMVAGATGTGKTVTLKILVEGFSKLGVPVFAADIKGDLSGIAKAGIPHPKIDERLAKMPVEDYQNRGCPTVFWDIFGKKGHPVRTTISDMGPLLLGNLLELNDTQSGVLYASFKIADDQGLLLLDLKDLRSLLSWVADNASELRTEYGNLSKTSIAAIQRGLLVLEEQGADRFFGEPAVALRDLMQRDFDGQGVVNILDATALLQQSPRLYATALLWLLAELFEQLPEVGDAEQPRLVFFFDEAHLLFGAAPKALLEKLTQVVRLIRSKGVGVYFISQNPADIPDEVLSQLGLRIQHALRAFTPKDRKAVKAVADNFRPNPALDTAAVVTELGIGEALISALDANGSPTIVERVLVRPPECQFEPLTDAERQERIDRSPILGRYDTIIDRESAHEILKERAEKSTQQEQQAREKEPEKADRHSGSRRQGMGEAMLKSAMRSIGSTLGRRIVRGVLGSILGRR